MSEPRKCFYIPADAFVEGRGYIPSIVVEGKPGHTPLSGNGPGAQPWYFGMTYEEARQRAEKENLEQFGLTPDEARRIILSSMATPAPAPGRDECARCADTGVDLWPIPGEAGRYCRGCVVDVTGREPETGLDVVDSGLVGVAVGRYSSYTKPMLVRVYLLGVHLLLFPDSDVLTRRPNDQLASLLGEVGNPEALRESLRAISAEMQARGIDPTHL